MKIFTRTEPDGFVGPVKHRIVLDNGNISSTLTHASGRVTELSGKYVLSAEDEMVAKLLTDGWTEESMGVIQ